MPKPDRPKRRNAMERLVEEAQAEGLLHGDTGRTILSDAEIYKEGNWLQRSSLVLIIGIPISIALAYLRLPTPLVWITFGSFVLGAVYCFVQAGLRLVRAHRIRHGFEATIPTRSEEYLKDLTPGEQGSNERASRDA